MPFLDSTPNMVATNLFNKGQTDNTNTMTNGNFHDDSSDNQYVTNHVEGLGNRTLLDKIDKLRELNVGGTIPLPQLVVVGDQSSGKSSLLAGLTGFSLPRDTGLCTRYATQITCRRETTPSVEISIIPRPGADDILKARLREFRMSLDGLREGELAQTFEEANRVMGIRPTGPLEFPYDDLVTFSEDILKIEINGPEQPALTVIDVPGIFRTATEGLTTDSDIAMVTSMVQHYMKDSRTIILAVIPCNVDIATQGILKMAKDADPEGSRTMGVLTKPDLAVERATQQNVLDLVQGKKQNLKLGYCVVKNFSADDDDCSLQRRNMEENSFFKKEPWSAIASSKRVGIEALKERLRKLLMDISKKEFPMVQAEIRRNLASCEKRLEDMGVSRVDERAQRSYLGKITAVFERIVRDALNAYYTTDSVFNNEPDMRLVTRVIELNKVLAKLLTQRGHAWYFDQGDDENEQEYDDDSDSSENPLPEPKFEIPPTPVDLLDLLPAERYECPMPSRDSIMDHIEDVVRNSQGPELGTFGGAVAGIIFKEQSKRWKDIVLSHVRDTIVIVHQFIEKLLDHVFVDKQVKEELYNNVLLEKLQDSYKKAMDHAQFLLQIELDGTPVTYNQFFNMATEKNQLIRLIGAMEELATNSEGGDKVIRFSMLEHINLDRSNPRQMSEYLHDIVKSYYEVALRRFMDVVCQQVIFHFLLNSKEGPLHVFSNEMVFELNASTLDMVAGEDEVKKQEREQLEREIVNLRAAMKVLRG